MNGGISLASDFARKHMAHVAMAASLQLLTTRVASEFGRKWRITSKGLRWLNEHKETQ